MHDEELQTTCHRWRLIMTASSVLKKNRDSSSWDKNKLASPNSSQSARIHRINSTNNSIHLRQKRFSNSFLSCYDSSISWDFSFPAGLFISACDSFIRNHSFKNSSTIQFLAFSLFFMLFRYFSPKYLNKQKPTITL